MDFALSASQKPISIVEESLEKDSEPQFTETLTPSFGNPSRNQISLQLLPPVNLFRSVEGEEEPATTGTASPQSFEPFYIHLPHYGYKLTAQSCELCQVECDRLAFDILRKVFCIIGPTLFTPEE